MRQIKQRALAAGPQGVKLPGHTYTVSDAEADAAILGGYAEEVTESALSSASDQAEEPEVGSAVETAEAPKGENAAERTNGKQPRRRRVN